MRRIKAAIGMGLTWALAWFSVGLVLMSIVGFGVAEFPIHFVFGVMGFIGGATFSGVLGLLGGRRRFDQLSLPRFAGWGGLGGILLAGVVVAFNVFIGDRALLAALPRLVGALAIFGVAGAASAAGTLALARRAEDAPSLGTASADAGLTEREKRELLGDGG